MRTSAMTHAERFELDEARAHAAVLRASYVRPSERLARHCEGCPGQCVDCLQRPRTVPGEPFRPVEQDGRGGYVSPVPSGLRGPIVAADPGRREIMQR